MTNLVAVNLGVVDLRGANLVLANLTEADLDRTDLDGAKLRATVFADVDSSSCEGLERCEHTGPSAIDIRTLQCSGPLPLAVLRRVGLPDTMIEHLG